MKKENKGLELRMMGLVPYNISPIQQGIQYSHAVVEYGLHNFDDEEYQDWARNWKTFIILNGGTSNDGHNSLDDGIINQGTMEKHSIKLRENKVTTAIFKEPDLNNMLSGIVFIVDERVFKKRKYNSEDPDEKYYPDFEDWYYELYPEEKGIYNGCSLQESYPEFYEEWLELIGGEKNLFLRGFLPRFKLA